MLRLVAVVLSRSSLNRGNAETMALRQKLPVMGSLAPAGASDATRPYVVVRSVGDLDLLSVECSRLMGLGYVPAGTLVVAACFDRSGAFIVEYYQPMVRDEKHVINSQPGVSV